MKKILLSFSIVSISLCAQTVTPPSAGGGGGGNSPAGSACAVQLYGTNTTFAGDASEFCYVLTALATPSAPTVTPTCTGTCATEYDYQIECRNVVGPTDPSPVGMANNAASLDGTHRNAVVNSCPVGTTADVYRTAPVVPPYYYAFVGNVAAGGTLIDNGIVSQFSDSNFGDISTNPNLSQGGFIANTLRSTGGFFLGPTYLGRTSQFSGDNWITGLSDVGVNFGVDMTTGTSVEMYFTLSPYNATADIRQTKVGQIGIDGYLNPDGTNAFQDFFVNDISKGNPTSGLALLALDPIDSFYCTSPCGTLDTGGTFTIGGQVTTNLVIGGSGNIKEGTVVFASLPATTQQMEYCSDCTVTSGVNNTCVGSGTGAHFEVINGVKKCWQ